MKDEDFLRTFGTKNPSARQFCDWVLENDPLTWQKWNPSLNDNEKALLNDSEVCQDCPWGYHYENVKVVALVISQIREAKKSDISDESLLLLLGKFENEKKKFLTPKKETTIVLFEVIPLLNKYGISIDEVIDGLGQKFQARKEVILQDLSQWTIKNNTIYNLKSQIHIGPYPFSSDKYDFLKKTIIQAKIKDIKNNPRNWKIVGKVDMYGENRTYVKRKDNQEELNKELFTFGEFTKIEWRLEGWRNIKFWLPMVILVLLILTFLFVFFWKRHRRKKHKEIAIKT